METVIKGCYTQWNTFYLQPNEMVSQKEVMTLSLYLMYIQNKMKIKIIKSLLRESVQNCSRYRAS